MGTGWDRFTRTPGAFAPGLALFGILALAGCQLTLTDRFEMSSNGAVKVRLIEQVDDQMATFMSSNGSASWENPFKVDEAGPWAVTRSLNRLGLHVVETSRTFANVDDVALALRALAAQATNGAAGVPLGIDSLANEVRETMSASPAGLFETAQHVHVDVPPILSPEAEQSLNPFVGQPGLGYGRSLPGGDQLLRSAGVAMTASLLSVRTEIALPYHVVSTNGERLLDGSYRWLHPLRSPSTIDLTFKTPEVTNIVIASTMGAIALLGIFAAGFRALAQRQLAQRPASA